MNHSKFFFLLFLNYFYIAKSAEININDKLIMAAENDDIELARECLNNGADKDYKSEEKHGVTPLIVATEHQNENMVKFLIERKANVNARSKNQCTALYTAVWHENFAIAKILIEAKADVNAQNERGHTSLMLATCLKNKTLIHLLISSGADLNLIYKQDINVFAFAQRNEEIENFIQDTYIEHIGKQTILKKKKKLRL